MQTISNCIRSCKRQGPANTNNDLHDFYRGRTHRFGWSQTPSIVNRGKVTNSSHPGQHMLPAINEYFISLQRKYSGTTFFFFKHQDFFFKSYTYSLLKISFQPLSSVQGQKNSKHSEGKGFIVTSLHTHTLRGGHYAQCKKKNLTRSCVHILSCRLLQSYQNRSD